MTIRAGTLSSLAEESAALAPSMLSDSLLLAAGAELAAVRRRVDAAAARLAAEVARRSAPDAGYGGLAQRTGMRTPERLVQQVTGASARDARTLVRVGSLLSDAPGWLAPVGSAVAAGALGVDAADAIRTGLGDVDPAVVGDTVTRLVALAPTVTVDRLAAEARAARDALDVDGVADREQQLRDRRSLTLTPLADGMTRLNGLLDPESAAIVAGAVDAVTSPRRAGPRFVDPTAVTRTEEVLRDTRSVEQMTADALVDMIRLATRADDGTVFGVARPAVTVLVTAHELREHRGVARLEGQTTAVSIATAQRHLCSGGLVAAIFDATGQPVDVGRDQRLFTRRQRVALAARDGGCRYPGCDRPPSWTEAHHITEWSRGG
ncbi:MAG TPA: DUF222 domain-containing protein, partial [Pseudolysinimonas sp.]|nr:DUF222 domain-containing protein [Pseudolysinimonas sp.]